MFKDQGHKEPAKETEKAWTRQEEKRDKPGSGRPCKRSFQQDRAIAARLAADRQGKGSVLLTLLFPAWKFVPNENTKIQGLSLIVGPQKESLKLYANYFPFVTWKQDNTFYLPSTECTKYGLTKDKNAFYEISNKGNVLKDFLQT